MHEISIVEALLGQVEGEVRRAGQSGRVTQLNLIVGRMSGVSVDSLRFAFELLAPGTIVEGARLEIAEPAAECRCKSCGTQSPIPDLVIQCPRCGSEDIQLVGGRELLLDSIELEDE